MHHIRIDQNELNKDRAFACGVSPLPEGDKWVYDAEVNLHGLVDCPGCGGTQRQFGIPASSMNGNASQRHEDPAAWERWCAFSEGYGL